MLFGQMDLAQAMDMDMTMRLIPFWLAASWLFS